MQVFKMILMHISKKFVYTGREALVCHTQLTLIVYYYFHRFASINS